MLTSIGRNSHMKHATGAEGDHAKRRRERHRRPRHSTGRESTINHSTGIWSDKRRDKEHAQARAEQAAGWQPPQPG